MIMQMSFFNVNNFIHDLKKKQVPNVKYIESSDPTRHKKRSSGIYV